MPFLLTLEFFSLHSDDGYLLSLSLLVFVLSVCGKLLCFKYFSLQGV
jgi:hypothetical protein